MKIVKSISKLTAIILSLLLTASVTAAPSSMLVTGSQIIGSMGKYTTLTVGVTEQIQDGKRTLGASLHLKSDRSMGVAHLDHADIVPTINALKQAFALDKDVVTKLSQFRAVSAINDDLSVGSIYYGPDMRASIVVDGMGKNLTASGLAEVIKLLEDAKALLDSIR